MEPDCRVSYTKHTLVINIVRAKSSFLNNAQKAGIMEDNNPETTAELAHLAAVAALIPENKPDTVPCDSTDKACTRRWLESLSDCA